MIKSAPAAARHRTVGSVQYELTVKKVKRLNLRVRPDGSVAVSAPRRVPLSQVDAFVARNAAWVEEARRHAAALPAIEDTHSDEECRAVFEPLLDRLYLLVADRVPVKPALKVRFMKSRWGVCHTGKWYITLNKQLLDQPYEALEYVVLHELVHLLHPNHQTGFHQEMARLMPDYRWRRALLRSRAAK